MRVYYCFTCDVDYCADIGGLNEEDLSVLC